MPEKVWKDIDKIVKSLEEIPSNREIFEQYPETAENLFLSAVFHSTLKIPDDIADNIAGLKARVGEKLPGIIHDYFLDVGGGDKPASSHRRKKGIYYTPDCVAQFITKRTVGQALEASLDKLGVLANEADASGFVAQWTKTASLRILDPACGWGVFLLYAAELMDRFYVQSAIVADNLKNVIMQKAASRKTAALSGSLQKKDGIAAELDRIIKIGANPKKQILSHNIYGYDIDTTAAGIAGNLLQKKSSCRESGKTPVCDESFENLFSHYEHNIKTLDFISQYEEIDERYDFIIGNPPYFTIGGGGKGKSRTDYHSLLKEHSVFSPFFKSQSDIFYYFIIGCSKLLKSQGTLSFITPSYWMDNEHADLLRKYLYEYTKISEIIKFEPIRVFKSRHGGAPGVDASILSIEAVSSDRHKPEPFHTNGQMEISFDDEPETPAEVPDSRFNGINRFNVFSPGEPATQADTAGYLDMIAAGAKTGVRIIRVNQKSLTSGRWSFSEPDRVFGRLIKDGVKVFPLGDISPAELSKYHYEFEGGRGYSGAGICYIGQGQETGMSEVFLVDAEKARQLGLEDEILKPNLKNGNVKRFCLTDSGQLIVFLTDEDDIEQYPKIRNYLEPFRPLLETRQRVSKGVRKWYAVSIPQNISVFDVAEKIVVPYRSAEHRFAVDTGRHFNDGGDVRGLLIKEKFRKNISHQALACILNSSLIVAWYKKYGKKKGNIYEFFTLPMSRIPIILPNQQQKSLLEKLYCEISNLNIYRINDFLMKRNTEPGGEIEEINRKIRKLESQIDDVVNDLYGICRNPEFDPGA